MSGFNVARNRQQSRERRIAAEAFYDGEHSVKHDPTTCITTWLASGDAVEKLALVLLPDRDHHENCRTRKGGGPCDCWYKRAWPDCLSRAKAILSALTESAKR